MYICIYYFIYIFSSCTLFFKKEGRKNILCFISNNNNTRKNLPMKGSFAFKWVFQIQILLPRKKKRTLESGSGSDNKACPNCHRLDDHKIPSLCPVTTVHYHRRRKRLPRRRRLIAVRPEAVCCCLPASRRTTLLVVR